ncbi:MAG: hypothetical protein Q6365_000085 [Candidatus Sigynarchaeota archaeon]
MTYQPFEARVLPLIFYYIGLAIASMILAVKMVMKWKQRKVQPPLLMATIFAIFVVALSMLAAGLADSAMNGAYKDLYRFSLPFGYTMIILADIVLYKFGIVMTNRGKNAFMTIVVIGIVLAAVLFLPWNWWGYPDADIVDQVSIRLYSTLALIVYSYIIYITIASVCHKALADAKDPVARAGLKLMSWAMICMILFFLMFVFDTLLIVILKHPGYSEFVYAAWVFAVAFSVLMYVSVVLPEWFVQRLRK